MALGNCKFDAQDIEAAKILLQLRGNFERTLELKLDQNPAPQKPLSNTSNNMNVKRERVGHGAVSTPKGLENIGSHFQNGNLPLKKRRDIFNGHQLEQGRCATCAQVRSRPTQTVQTTDASTQTDDQRKVKANNIFCNYSRKVDIIEKNCLHDDTDYKADAEEDDEDELQEIEILQMSDKCAPQNNGKEGMVPIGLGNARVSSRVLKKVDWNGSYTTVTRKLLTAVFPRSVLATHSLTGKQSPAFPNKAAKRKLNPLLVDDIVRTVVNRCNVKETQVRTSITTKCADESKMLRKRLHDNNNGRKTSSCSS